MKYKMNFDVGRVRFDSIRMKEKVRHKTTNLLVNRMSFDCRTFHINHHVSVTNLIERIFPQRNIEIINNMYCLFTMFSFDQLGKIHSDVALSRTRYGYEKIA